MNEDDQKTYSDSTGIRKIQNIGYVGAPSRPVYVTCMPAVMGQVSRCEMLSRKDRGGHTTDDIWTVLVPV